MSKINFSLRSTLFLGVATAAALSMSAAASDTETVTVTGSRIPVSSNLAAPTAVTTISAENLQMTGTVNVADVLRSVPSFGASGLSSNNSNFFTTSAGINTLELRNLGESRTLVLVNGVRHVAGAAGSSSVDFNTVPTDMIDHIDVITGGASAIYGSDALAGVVNVILKTDFQGVAADVQHGRSDYNDDITYKLSATLGGNFANDKGNAWVNAAWSRNEGVMAKDRPNTGQDNTGSCTVANPQKCLIPVYGGFSSYSAYGRFAVPSTGQAFTVSSGVGPTGTVVPFVTSQYGFNRQAYRALETPVDRLVLTTGAHYDVLPNMTAYLDGTFASTSSEANIEPFPWDYTNLSNSDPILEGGIPLSNPFIPATIRNAAVAAGDSKIYFRRRTVEFGPRHYVARRNMYQVVIGLKGTIFKDYSWDTYFDWGHTLDTQSGSGQVSQPNARESLDARVAAANDVANGALNQLGAKAVVGDIVCNQTYAQNEGCVPVNLFGLGAINSAAVKYLEAPQSRVTNIDQQVIGGTIRGPVVGLPAGDIQAVAGFEYRREFSSDVPDALTQLGQNGGNKEAPTAGGFHVLEFFTEVNIPLLKDLPLAKELSVDGAWRWSQYNTVGVTNAYTGRLSWAPLEDLRFRGQYARAVRAPDINELFAPGGEDFAPVTDPCNGITAATTGALATNCRTDPGIAARIAATGSFTLSQAELQGTGGFSNKGNQALKPENSVSWSLGSIYSHDFGELGSVTASVDYFNINIKNFITTIGRNAALTSCYNGATFPNAFCNLIVRTHAGPTIAQGWISQINSGYVNEGYTKTSGVDFSLTYLFDLNEIGSLKNGGIIGLTDAGQIATRTNWTWLQSYTSEAFGHVDPEKGSLEIPTHKVQLALLYTNGPLSLQWETAYQSGVVDTGDPTAGVFHLVHFSNYWTSDLSASYWITDNFQVYGGINNIMNHPAPNVLSTVPGNTTGSNTDENAYDAIGRRFFIGGRVKL